MLGSQGRASAMSSGEITPEYKDLSHRRTPSLTLGDVPYRGPVQ
jgi:hypothetical protein